ncbi:phosphoglycerate mutase [Streptococcus suis]|uniref:Phosphoglycerate mutase n=2 Tax=Streptococcus suis TaxID=1307 RepID=A0A0Z8V270_STRSU|nr:phosphoglycerate mutase [Streptococcus suis]
MNYLYLMRHGQTRFNLQGRIQGACDSPLTEEGKE